VLDGSDAGTWAYWPDEGFEEGTGKKMRTFAEKFFGYTPETSPDRISNAEKAKLYRAAEIEVDGGMVPSGQIVNGRETAMSIPGITYEDIQRREKDDRAFAKAAEGLWAPFVLANPEIAQDTAGLGAAFARLRDGSGLSKRQLADLAESHEDELVERIAQEYMNPGMHSGIFPEDDAHDAWDHQRQAAMRNLNSIDDNRTGGMSGGSRGTAAGGNRSDNEKRGSSFDAIAAWQRKTGFHS
jgi:hypothetical protein